MRAVRIAGAVLCAAAALVASARAASAEGYTETRHPIVLAHGMGGFDELFGVYEYWHRIPEALADGGAEVYVTEVSQLNSTEARGEQLLAQVEEIVAVTGAPAVNLIGHSHGGLDVRYVAAVRPDLVASVTTIGSPHGGAALADFLRDHVQDGSFTQTVLSLFAEDLGDVLALISGTSHPQDAIAGLEALTSAGAEAFNARYPEGVPDTRCGEGSHVAGGIHYYSWTGDEWLTNTLDSSDLLLGLTGIVYDEPTDGLVGRCSAHLGRVIRDDYRMNHLDEVNQVFGLTYLFGPNPVSLFRIHANRLQRAGL